MPKVPINVKKIYRLFFPSAKELCLLTTMAQRLGLLKYLHPLKSLFYLSDYVQMAV